MTWWDDEFHSLPDREWVYRATYKGYLLPVGVKYWWYKIPQDANHKIQIARKAQADSTTIYLYTYPDDSPNWAGANLVEIAPPCSNWSSDVYLITETNRSQTWALRAAIQGTRELTPKIRAVVALTGELSDAITATIQANREEPIVLQVAVRGEASRDIGIKAAVRTERSLAPGIEAAVAKTDELPITILAAIRGYTQLPIRTRAAIKGEAQKRVGIIANVVVSRVPQIYLEMENLVPQELDLRSTPNWPSKVKDWRKDSIGK